MDEKLKYIECLFSDLVKHTRQHICCKKDREKELEAYRAGKRSFYPYDPNLGNRDHSKTALKRRITLLRQELLNLERMLNE